MKREDRKFPALNTNVSKPVFMKKLASNESLRKVATSTPHGYDGESKNETTYSPCQSIFLCFFLQDIRKLKFQCC
jgi:hypothetical protein